MTPAPPNPAPTAPAPRDRSLVPHPAAWVVLAISLAATAGGWFVSRMHVEMAAHNQFDEITSRITTSLTERMLMYQDALRGAKGLFAASVSVERNSGMPISKPSPSKNASPASKASASSPASPKTTWTASSEKLAPITSPSSKSRTQARAPTSCS